MLIYYPDKWKYLGTWDLSIILTDTNMDSIEYKYKLVITNSAPYFTKDRPKGVIMRLNEELKYSMPTFIDDENNPIYVVQKLPSFITYDSNENFYILKPKNPIFHLGNFLIKGTLEDTRLSTNFQFSVTVINKAPIFSGGKTLRDITLSLNSIEEVEIPQVEDVEGLPFKVKPSLADGSPLPTFIKYSSTAQKFTIYAQQQGSYIIRVCLEDGYSAPNCPRFKITVQK